MILNKVELIATFEASYEEDLKAAALTSQAKEIKDKRAERLSDFAKECEIDKKLVAKAYGRYKELKKGAIEADDEDFYTLMAAVDESFVEETEED